MGGRGKSHAIWVFPLNLDSSIESGTLDVSLDPSPNVIMLIMLGAGLVLHVKVPESSGSHSTLYSHRHVRLVYSEECTELC